MVFKWCTHSPEFHCIVLAYVSICTIHSLTLMSRWFWTMTAFLTFGHSLSAVNVFSVEVSSLQMVIFGLKETFFEECQNFSNALLKLYVANYSVHVLQTKQFLAFFLSIRKRNKKTMVSSTQTSHDPTIYGREKDNQWSGERKWNKIM